MVEPSPSPGGDDSERAEELRALARLLNDETFPAPPVRESEKAAEEDRYLTDMVLDAYRDHYAVMRDEYMAERGDVDLPFRPRRRKAATGRVTHMLYLAAPEVGVIDGSAVEIGLSRSEFVSQLLEREL